jgi:hypothetical protein
MSIVTDPAANTAISAAESLEFCDAAASEIRTKSPGLAELRIMTILAAASAFAFSGLDMISDVILEQSAGLRLAARDTAGVFSSSATKKAFGPTSAQ